MGRCAVGVSWRAFGEPTDKFRFQPRPPSRRAAALTAFRAAALVLLALGAGIRPAAAGPYDKGEYLARAGDCVACHSAPGGKAFAGGLKMGTPLGAIYATNITPDPETGIGGYTLADFDRALRRGIAKDGHRLYPAMPYPSYARLTDADVAALYDYFMKAVPPVHQENRPSEIPGLLAMRWPLAIWDVLFAGPPGHAQPDRDAAWNRGAYLVEGLGHCGACHTPRGWAWQETALDAASPRFLAGAELDAWSAPDLRGELRSGLGQWSKDDLVAFLKTGHNRDGAAFGSMIDVVNNSTPYLTDADLDAIATYLKSLPANEVQPAYVHDDATTRELRSLRPAATGAAGYIARCAACHRATGDGFSPYLPRLAGNPTVLDPDPASLINIVLNGSAPLVAAGTPDAYRMPQFRLALSDQQVADILTFIRAGWGNHAAPVTAEAVAALRRTTDPTSDRIVILKMR